MTYKREVYGKWLQGKTFIKTEEEKRYQSIYISLKNEKQIYADVRNESYFS